MKVEFVDVTSGVFDEFLVKLANQTRDGTPIHKLVYQDSLGRRCLNLSHPSGQRWTFRDCEMVKS